jgi:hypothetical protein
MGAARGSCVCTQCCSEASELKRKCGWICAAISCPASATARSRSASSRSRPSIWCARYSVRNHQPRLTSMAVPSTTPNAHWKCRVSATRHLMPMATNPDAIENTSVYTVRRRRDGSRHRREPPHRPATTRPAISAARLGVACAGANWSVANAAMAALSSTTMVCVRLGRSPPASASSAGVKMRVGPGYQSCDQSMRSGPRLMAIAPPHGHRRRAAAAAAASWPAPHSGGAGVRGSWPGPGLRPLGCQAGAVVAHLTGQPLASQARHLHRARPDSDGAMPCSTAFSTSVSSSPAAAAARRRPGRAADRNAAAHPAGLHDAQVLRAASNSSPSVVTSRPSSSVEPRRKAVRCAAAGRRAGRPSPPSAAARPGC